MSTKKSAVAPVESGRLRRRSVAESVPRIVIQVSVRYLMPTDLANSRRILEPVRSGSPWLAWGVAIQALGVAPVAAIMWRSIRHQRSLGGHVTAEMIRFAWH